MISCVGVMFAPHHQDAADELVRVDAPGWPDRPAQLDAGGLHRPDVRDHEALRPAAAARCAAAAAVGRRGPRARAARRPGDRRRRRAGARCRSTGSRSGAEFRDFFKATYGPTITVYRSIADDPARVAELDAALAALGDAALADGRMEWEYLLLTAAAPDRHGS